MCSLNISSLIKRFCFCFSKMKKKRWKRVSQTIVSVAHCDDAHMSDWFGRQLIAAHFIVFGHWWRCTLVVGPSPPSNPIASFAVAAVAAMASEPSEGTDDAVEVAAFFALLSK
jgi:hypothetical protein